MNDGEPDPFPSEPWPDHLDHPDHPGHSGLHGDASASGNARVGQQAGLNNGTMYHAGDTYNINPGDSPERRRKIALRLLAFNAPRQAEEILGPLLWNEEPSTELAYYYVLSVLSGRSWHDLHGELADRIKDARKIGGQLDRDSFSAALDVIWRLLDLVRQELDSAPEADRSFDFHSLLAGLPPERQEEIGVHLDVILDGVRGDRLQAERVGQVVTRRLGGHRAERARLFFEHDPERPRQDIVRVPAPGVGEWARAVGGAVGFLVLLALLMGSFAVVPALGAAGLVAAGYLLVRHGSGRATQARIEAYRRDAVAVGPPARPRSPGHWTRNDFVQDIHLRVDLRFSAVRPHLAGTWSADTAQARAELKQRIVDRYGNLGVEPEKLDWLIRWHTIQAARQWRARASEASAAESSQAEAPAGRRPTSADLLCYLGAVVAAGSLLALTASGELLAALLLGTAGSYAVSVMLRIRATQGLRRSLGEAARERHAEEMRAYDRWLEVLAARPDDLQMAHWLAMDRIYLWIDAANRAKLLAQDILAHVVILEGVPSSAQAQAGRGVRRYARYQAQIFLLTRDGVRESTAELDFRSGEVRDERRTNFRYDAVASARVAERGTRTTRPGRQAPLDVERLHSRTFRLTLLDGTDVAVVRESFSRGSDGGGAGAGAGAGAGDGEDEPQFSLQDSGTERALPLLESVAAEGADWIARQQEHRRRWAQDWSG